MSKDQQSSNLTVDSALLARAMRICDNAGAYDCAEHINRAAIQIERLTRERDELIHDVERHMRAAAAESDESERLTREIERQGYEIEAKEIEWRLQEQLKDRAVAACDRLREVLEKIGEFPYVSRGLNDIATWLHMASFAREALRGATSAQVATDLPAEEGEKP